MLNRDFHQAPLPRGSEEAPLGKINLERSCPDTSGIVRRSAMRLRVRWLIDFCASVLFLPVLLPIMAICAIAIRLDSKGPIIFVQSRMGFLGKPFACFKLRTMCNEMEGPPYTEINDPRVTRVGRFIRKWHLDELPQVFNILLGEMSWIGPRPEALELARQYAQHFQYYGVRHTVLPGITGWAAVHQGNVSGLEAVREKLEYDAYYVRHRSIWLDCGIVLKTIQVVARGTGVR